VGHSPVSDGEPSTWVPAQVPGAVQLDWAAGQGWGPFYWGDNWRDYGWMEDAYWTYRAMLPTSSPGSDSRAVLVCCGVDYACRVFVGERLVHEQEGMFTPFEIDVSEHLGQELRIVVSPAPKEPGVAEGRDQARRSCKPAVSYGWDFHPRLIPLGIWDETYLQIWGADRLADAETRYRLAEDLNHADLELRVVADGSRGARVRWQVEDDSGRIVVDQTGPLTETQTARLDQPELWWPHDQGPQTRYRSRVMLLDGDGQVLDERVQAFGLRRVRLVMHEGAWTWPDSFPKTRSNPPITLEVNGRRIFGKGANWVSPDIFPGTLDEGRYREQLELAKGANMNLLRMWGGAPVQKEAFYRLCDELGIMVWQEFPLACNAYPDDPDYLRVVDQESRSILRRLRRHPSVVLWCGGNELFNGWSGMTDQSHALRLLNANCFELDRQTPFLPTSPVMGMGHGHYVFADLETGEEAWSLFQNASCTAYTEFGCGGPSPEPVLRSFLPEDELFPPKPGTVWETHHAFGVWMPQSHLYLETIEHYLGPVTSLEDLVEKGQLLQAEGFRGLFEEARRQMPVASMALNWCLNEPWPCAANNSLLAWPCEPKPALQAVGEACRPSLASARVRKFMWRPGEWFDPELWVLHDGPEEIEGGAMVAELDRGTGFEPLLSWDFPTLAPNQNLRGPRVQFQLPPSAAGRMVLRLSVEGRPELESRYTLVLSTGSSNAPTLKRLNF